MMILAIILTAYAAFVAYALGHHLCGWRALSMLMLAAGVSLVLWIQSAGWILGLLAFAAVFAVVMAGAARFAAHFHLLRKPA